mgnify:CR=1 FL=1
MTNKNLKTKKIYNKLKNYFNEYTSQFEMKDEDDQKNIQLKIDHSLRVTKDMEEITAEMEISEADQFLAKIIALYHDIGRFKQYQEYKTFSDYKSEDHGELGVKIIEENNLLAELKKREKEIVCKAIKQHNRAKLDKNNLKNEREIFFAKLIRDADKLDIFNIFADRYKSGNQKDYIIKLSDKPVINDEIYNKTLRAEAVNYDRLETLNDLKVMQLGWIYDINFKETKKIIKNRNYLEIIYKSMDINQRAKKIYKKIKREL